MIRRVAAVLGRARLQPVWRAVVRVGQRFQGLNVPTDVAASGEARMLARLLPRLGAGVIIDGGAHDGSYTATVRRLAPARQVFAFEPSRRSFEALRARFAGDPRVTVSPLGLSDRPASVELFSDRAGSQVASVYARRLDHYGATMVPEETASLVTLDEFCRDRAIDRVALFKLDVEGHELAALRGAERLFAERKVEAAQFEFGGTAIDARVYLQDFWYWFEARRFVVHRILPSGELEPIRRYHEGHEVFWAANYVALRKD